MTSRMRLLLGATAALRPLAAGSLVALALVHLFDLPSKLDETPFLGVLYILGPITASVLAAVLIVGSNRRIGWLLGGAIAAATAIGYCLSRTTGLPHAHDDIGNWTEPLGVGSLIADGLVVLLATAYLLITRRAPDQAIGPTSTPSSPGIPVATAHPRRGRANAYATQETDNHEGATFDQRHDQETEHRPVRTR